MNKQLVLAALFATAHAQTACDDANVRTAQAAKKALDLRKVSLESSKTSLAALAKTELAAYTAAKGNYDKQDGVMAPFRAALKTASDNHKTQNDKSLAATAALSALTGPLAARAQTLASAKKAVADQEAKINTQKGVVAKLTAAVTEHTAEAKVVASSLTSAGDAYKKAFDADAAKKQEYDNAKAAQETKVSGTTALKTTKGDAASAAAKDTGLKVNTESSTFGTYKTKKQAYDEAKKKLDDYTTACNGNCATSGNPIGKLKSDQTTVAGVVNKDTGSGAGKEYAVAKDAWETALKALTASQKTQAVADQEKATADQNEKDAAKLVGDTDGAYKALVKLTTAAKSTKDDAVKADTRVKDEVKQAGLDLGRGTSLLGNLETALRPLQDAVVIATHMHKLEDDKKKVQDAAKAAAQLNLADLASLKSMADATVTRATIKLTFYKGLMDTAKSGSDAAAGQVSANAGALTKNGADIKAAEGAIAVAVAACKGAGYTLAQTAVKALQDKQAAAKAAATKVKTDYDKVSTAPTDGSANTRCEYPTPVAGAQAPRKVCKEGLCCGAAQKFMRDGTKIAVETCQKQMGTSTYTYYPPLATGAAVAPIPQVWRFACISGAQKLAATAAAALAAGYMMA